MINFLVTRGHDGTITPYLETWIPHLADRFTVMHYEDLPELGSIPSGTTIFADLERLAPAQTRLALAVRDCIIDQAPGTLILNDPETALLRYDLLEALHKQDLIPFRAYRLTDTTRPERFPVFIRYEHDHTGPKTRLLHDQDEVDAAILGFIVRRRPLRRLLMVEFCETADAAGLYTKYGAFIVNNRVIARHLNVEKQWIVKGAGIDQPEIRTTELEYIDANPEEEEISRVAAIAGIGYGRIDYSILDGRMITWEINTDPVVVKTKESQTEITMRRQEHFIPRLTEALMAIDETNRHGEEISLEGLPATVRDAARRRPVAAPNIRRVRSMARPVKPLIELGYRGAEVLATPFRDRLITSRLGSGTRIGA